MAVDMPHVRASVVRERIPSETRATEQSPIVSLGRRRGIGRAGREAAFAMFAEWYNYIWQTRKPGKSGKKRPTAAMMAGLAGHVWSFDELFDAVLANA